VGWSVCFPLVVGGFGGVLWLLFPLVVRFGPFRGLVVVPVSVVFVGLVSVALLPVGSGLVGVLFRRFWPGCGSGLGAPPAAPEAEGAAGFSTAPRLFTGF